RELREGPFPDLRELLLKGVPVMEHTNGRSGSEEILRPLLNSRFSEDLLEPLLVNLALEPAPHLLETGHAIRHSGSGPTLSPIDSLKNVGHAGKARHLLDAEHGRNLHLGLATAGQ